MGGVMRSMFHSAAALLLSCGSQCLSASNLSDIIGIDINIPKGTIRFGPPRLDQIPHMLQNLPKDMATFFLDPVGGGLAFAIRHDKEKAREACSPMPQQVAADLAAFFPRDIFQSVCYALVSNGYSLASFAIRDVG